MENPSLCIPRVFHSVTRHQIRKVIGEMQLGELDFIDLHLSREYQKVFVYFKTWYTTPFATSIRKRFLDGEELKIIYNDPWFWKCSLNRLRTARGGYGRSGRTQRTYVSKYNTSNQLIALRKVLAEQRAEFARALTEKDQEIKRLSTYISACMGDDLLLKKKKQAQGKYLKRYLICKSAGILFS